MPCWYRPETDKCVWGALHRAHVATATRADLLLRVHINRKLRGLCAQLRDRREA